MNIENVSSLFCGKQGSGICYWSRSFASAYLQTLLIELEIERAFDFFDRKIFDRMGINHCCSHITMTEQILNSALWRCLYISFPEGLP